MSPDVQAESAVPIQVLLDGELINVKPDTEVEERDGVRIFRVSVEADVPDGVNTFSIRYGHSVSDDAMVHHMTRSTWHSKTMGAPDEGMQPILTLIGRYRKRSDLLEFGMKEDAIPGKDRFYDFALIRDPKCPDKLIFVGFIPSRHALQHVDVTKPFAEQLHMEFTQNLERVKGARREIKFVVIEGVLIIVLNCA